MSQESSVTSLEVLRRLKFYSGGSQPFCLAYPLGLYVMLVKYPYLN